MGLIKAALGSAGGVLADQWKWMANADSYMNDVKFVGGHGGLWKPKPGVEERQRC